MKQIAIPNIDIIAKCWGEIEPFLQLAINESNGELNLEGIIKSIESKDLLLAVVFDDDGSIMAVCAFEIRVFQSGKKVVHIMSAGGHGVDDWFEQIEQIAVDLAKNQGCSEVYIIGRKGWERKMKHLGYSHAHTILCKEVK